MKKTKYLLLLLLLSLFPLTACSKLVNNEIYNKSYNVGTISLENFEDLIVAVVEKVSPAVIGVSNYSKGLIPGTYSLCCTGSGVIYRGLAHMKNGEVLPLEDTVDSSEVSIYEYFFVTNRHVVFADNKLAEKLEVYIGEDDEKIAAELLQFDPQVDLAAGKFFHTKYIQAGEFADSDQVKAGNFALAIGSPSGIDYYGSVTFGIVSFPKRYIAEVGTGGVSDWDAEYIQHDVAINPGNSGGPLFNIAGQIIGINTMKFAATDIDNMGFSIPSNLVASILPILEAGEQPQRARLGITGFSVRGLEPQELVEYNIPSDLRTGIYVDSIMLGGVADKANLQPGDIILSLEGIEIRYSYEIRAILNRFSIDSGQVAVLTIYRDGEIITIDIIF